MSASERSSVLSLTPDELHTLVPKLLTQARAFSAGKHPVKHAIKHSIKMATLDKKLASALKAAGATTDASLLDISHSFLCWQTP